MLLPRFIPLGYPAEIEKAVEVIQKAYESTSWSDPLKHHQILQKELPAILKSPGWSLVWYGLNHPDPVVQFFGAYTIQLKTATEWATIPENQRIEFRDCVLGLTTHAAAIGCGKPVLRKLFATISALAIKLAMIHPALWHNWITASMLYFHGCGVLPDHVFDFACIAVEEVAATAPGLERKRMQQTVMDAVPCIIKEISHFLPSLERHLASGDTEPPPALKCIQTWEPYFSDEQRSTLAHLL